MKNVIEYILNRIQEPSTIRGVIMLAGGFGITLDPEHIKEYISLAFIIVGAVNVYKKDAASKDSTVMESVKNE